MLLQGPERLVVRPARLRILERVVGLRHGYLLGAQLAHLRATASPLADCTQAVS